MIRYLRVFSTVLLIAAAVCLACLGEESPELHEHSYETVIIPAQCETPEYAVHICACGDEWSEITGQPTGHCFRGGVCELCGMPEPVETCEAAGPEDTEAAEVEAPGIEGSVARSGDGSGESFSVTIPASLAIDPETLEGSFTIAADGIAEGTELSVRITSENGFRLAAGSSSLAYHITCRNDRIENGGTAVSFAATGSAELLVGVEGTPTDAGTYRDSLTFEVVLHEQ